MTDSIFPSETDLARLLEDLEDFNQNGTPIRMIPSVVSRAYDALKRLRPLRPIPVHERMPEPQDCLGRPTASADAGWCWVWIHRWEFCEVLYPRPYPKEPIVVMPFGTTHWLPHYSLPVPLSNITTTDE